MNKSLHTPFETVGATAHWGYPLGYGFGDLDSAEARKARECVAYLHELGQWNIFWRWRRNEAGKFEVNFVCRTPYATGVTPYTSEVVEIFAGCRHHVESKAVLVCGETRWRHWIRILSAQKSGVQPLLLGMRTECGCDTWLHTGPSAQVYERMRIGLHHLNEITD